MKTKISKVFDECKKQGRPCFVGFVTAGFPSIEESPKILLAMQNGGVDIIEVGVPFSDPLADGKMIQYANQVALKNGVNMMTCFKIVEKARQLGLTVPVVFMGYSNPFYAFGLEKLFSVGKEVSGGIDGLIIVDLPIEEAKEWLDLCKKNSLAYIPLIAPTSSESRIKQICDVVTSNSESCAGFVYVISSLGVTGQRAELNKDLGLLVEKVKKFTNVPLAVGFGISNREQFNHVGRLSNGVVIGSGFIKTIKDALEKGENVEDAVKNFALQVGKVDGDNYGSPKNDTNPINVATQPIEFKETVQFHFGEFGGRFAPETLNKALEDLDWAFEKVLKDPEFWNDFKKFYPFINRPSSLQFANNLTNYCGGARIWLKREDLNHTGSHKVNNALGQVLLAKRLGKSRIIAETGAGQHGVATATLCAHFKLKCTIYMGKTDTLRQSLNVFRMKLLGAEVIPVEKYPGSGEGTLKDAINEAMRDWVSQVEDTHYLVGSAIGPHPFPKIVREFQSIMGKEVLEQFPIRIKEELNVDKKLPDALIACVGGGSNAIGLFSPFLIEKVRFIGCQAGGEGNNIIAPLVTGKPGILHGCRTYLVQDENGQIGETHSISAGLDYPAVGPQHSQLKDSNRAEYVAVNNRQALEGFQIFCKTEGIIPALETSHAIYHAIQLAKISPKDFDIIIGISGRGDKDVQQVQNLLPSYNMQF